MNTCMFWWKWQSSVKRKKKFVSNITKHLLLRMLLEIHFILLGYKMCFSAHGLSEKSKYRQFLCCARKGAVASLAITAVRRTKRTSECCHICTGGTEGSRWGNTVYIYCTGVVSSAAHHPYQHCCSIYYEVILFFSHKCEQMHVSFDVHVL